jgi:hypothetical protein
MLLTTLLIIHISTATIGLLSGVMSMSFRKGSGWHGAAGNVFVPSMLLMSATGAYIATFLKPLAGNVIASSLTFYLVSTAWRAAKDRTGRTNSFDTAAFVFILAVGVAGIGFGIETVVDPAAFRVHLPAAIYFVFGSVALLCAFSDARMLVRRSISGAQRMMRHLRMPVALLIALMSFYPGQAKLFPQWLRATKVLLIPHVLVIASLLFWTIRIGRRMRQRRASAASVHPAEAIATTHAA